MISKSSKANFFLLIAAMIWGLNFPIVSNALHGIQPSTFTMLQFVIAAVVLFPFAWTSLKTVSPRAWLFGFILASLTAATYITQTIGLKTIEPSRAAFIIGMSVLLVPLLQPLFKLQKPRHIEWVAAIICIIGLYILTGADIHQISKGDLWSMASSLLNALDIIYLQVIARHFKNPILLTFLEMIFGAMLLSLLTTHASFHSVFISPLAIGTILFCGIITLSLGFYLEIRYQPDTTATKAMLIYSLEPVFASLGSYFLYGQALTNNILIGGSIMLASLVLPGVVRARENQSPDGELV